MTRRGLLDSGYQGDASPPAIQRYVPSRAQSVGTHQLQDGRITSNFNVTADQLREELLQQTHGCCYGCKERCSRLGLHCCAAKTPPSCKVIALWSWLLLVSLLLGLNFRYAILDKAVEVSLGPGDQYIMTKLLSPTFCSSLVITSRETFSAKRVSHEPSLSDTGEVTYNVNYTQWYLSGNKYMRVYFRLLAGSILHFSIKPERNMLEFYVIQGEENWKTWKQSQRCTDCYLTHYHCLES